MKAAGGCLQRRCVAGSVGRGGVVHVASVGLRLLGAGGLEEAEMRRHGARTRSDYRWWWSLDAALDLRLNVSARRMRRLAPRTYECLFNSEAVTLFRSKGALCDDLSGALHTRTLGRRHSGNEGLDGRIHDHLCGRRGATCV